MGGLGGLGGGGPITGGQAGAAGSGGGGGFAGAAALTPVVNAFCATARSCCAGQSEAADLNDCEAKVAARQPISAVQSGSARVDATALAACLAAYQQAATGCLANPVIEACHGVFVGTKQVGENCSESGYDCDSQQGPTTCLITEQNGTTGTCRAVPRGKAGDGCISTCRIGDSCSSVTYGAAGTDDFTLCFEVDGLYCDILADDATCRPLVVQGMPCNFSEACGSAGTCSGTCLAAAGPGQPCGAGCRHELTCIDDRCQSPTFAGVNSCDGYSLGP
jgi:hypothetical protein